MIKTLIPVVFKEYFRSDNNKRIFQFLFFIIVPIFLFLTLTLSNSSIFFNRESVLLSIDFLIAILVTSFSLLYISDPEDKIFEDYPINYLPIKKFYIFAVIFFFLFLFLLFTFCFLFYSISLLLSLIKINGKNIFSFSEILSFLSPSFLSLPYNLIVSLLTGGLIGILIKKISEIFEGGFKKFILFVFYFLVLLLFKKYFSYIYTFIQKNDLNNLKFLFSTVGFSSNILLLILKKSGFLYFTFSFIILTFMIFLFKIFSDLNFLLPFQKDIEFDFKIKKTYNVSSIFKLIFKRVFNFTTTFFFVLWFLLLILSYIFIKNFFFFTFLSLTLYIYLFVFFDKLLPSREENYIFILDTVPISFKKFEGVVYLFYYLFAFLPVIFTSLVSLLKTNYFSNLQIIKSLEYFMFLFFFPLVMSAVFPFYYSLFPNFLSENKNGKKLTRGGLLLVFITTNFIFSIINSIVAVYYSSPEARNFINNLFWKKGYFVGKTFFYFIFLFSIFVHIRSFLKIIKSFK
uniref:Uncharacterized protein n=1 Tax=candidate division WOR-3 bacterium TaxID=2052148 RepID=A0A7C3N7R7_UNCW3